MAILPIVKYPDQILKTKASEVDEINSEIKTMLSNMAETMYDAPGIGLAGPQIGTSLRLCVVDVGDDEATGRIGRLYKLVNPEIVSKEGRIKYEEGCLSIPGIHEFVERASKIVVKAKNEDGESVTIEAEGLLAICLQHEIDHLDGILFTDRLTGLKRRIVLKKLQKNFLGT
jgi:peptide deformylase